MHRRLRQAIALCVLALAFVVVAAPAVAAPAGGATELTLTNPTGDALRDHPPAQDTHVTVSWTVDRAVSGGYFCILLVNAKSEQAEYALKVRPIRRATAYSSDFLLEHLYEQGDYYVLVNYRAHRGATPSLSDRTDRTFRFQAGAPFYHTDAFGMSPSPAAIPSDTGTPVTFTFWVVDPLERAVTSADVVFFTTIGGAETRFPIADAAGLTIAAECGGDPSLLNQRTVECNLPAGYYMWYIDTLPGGGAGLIDGGYIGTLTVTRR